jgi:hypothetical protein
MPGLGAAKDDTKFQRLLVLGDSGTGKTGALESLVREGYKIRIFDFDMGVAPLAAFVEKNCPERLNQVEYQSFRDKLKMTNTGPKVVGGAKAFPNAMAALTTWEDGSTPSEWGPDTIAVIDSGTMLGDAAMNWAKATNPSVRDPRQWYSEAQRLVFTLMANITSEDFHAHVIVNTHIEVTTTDDGKVKGHPSFIGKALGPKVPALFNDLVLFEKRGAGTSVKRQIHTTPTALIDVKTHAPFNVQKSYDIETGMAQLFKDLGATL